MDTKKMQVYVGNSMPREDRLIAENRTHELDAVEVTIAAMRIDRIILLSRMENACVLLYEGSESALLELQERLRDYSIDASFCSDGGFRASSAA